MTASRPRSIAIARRIEPNAEAYPHRSRSGAARPAAERRLGGSDALDGEVTAIDKNSFMLQGKVTTRAEGIFDGKDCVREGEYTFLRKGTRKYWRIQSFLNPCDNPVADYIDIYPR
jgi:hypothetical protein